MGRKQSKDAGGAAAAAAGKGKAATKKETPSVSTILASMDQKPANPKKKGPSSKSKPQAYTDGIDLPPSEDDEDYASGEEGNRPVVKKEFQRRPDWKPHIDHEPSLKEKPAKKENRAPDSAKKETLKDEQDAFTVVIGSRASDRQEAAGDGDANMKDISISNFSVSVRGKELLKNVDLKISHGKRYGLIGPNGTGKSTLLKLLAWRKIPVPKNIDVLLVEQEVVGNDQSALQAVVSADEELVKLRQEVEKLQKLASASDGDGDGDGDGDCDGDGGGGAKLAELYDKLEVMGSDGAEARASKILAGLGISTDKQAQETRLFSGGWRMRISLARALFVQPTLLLLDEPTNHLDLRAVLWLEEYLCRWKNTLVVVSHDRDFLNTVCTDIIHLHKLKLHMYRGNFDDFEKGYEEWKRVENKRAETYEKQKKAAQRSGSKVQQEKVKDRAKFAAKKDVSSNSRGKGNVDDDDVPTAEAPTKCLDYTVEFHFPEPTELKRPLLQLVEVSFRYPGQPDFTLSNVCVDVDMGTRVAIVGPNGAGKSTLLKLLDDKLVPTKREDLIRNPKLRIGSYSQHFDFEDLLTVDETPVQYLWRLYPEQFSKQQDVHDKLGKYGLKGHNHHTPIAKLSGGQKARVTFASISLLKPHILLLDEPTNHLDMQSIDALADALDEFAGGVVLVSHDSRLISRVCNDEEDDEKKMCQIWVVQDGTVKLYKGTFEEYKEEMLGEIRDEVDD